MKPAALPARGRGQIFDWQRNGRRVTNLGQLIPFQTRQGTIVVMKGMLKKVKPSRLTFATDLHHSLFGETEREPAHHLEGLLWQLAHTSQNACPVFRMEAAVPAMQGPLASWN